MYLPGSRERSIPADKEKEAKFHCYISLDKERALKRAEQVQAAIDAGELAGPLAGVPIAVKDNICTKDVKTTCASRILSILSLPTAQKLW
ncbi:MAG: amidase family protein [Eisenbergiella massiliensis]